MSDSDLEELKGIEELKEFAQKVFLCLGFSDDDAALSANFLIRADLRGIDSHGIARLSGYVRLIQAGRLNPKPGLEFESRFPTLSLLDADKAIGFVAGTHAMKKCIQMAKEYGCGMVAVRNSNHFGIAAQYALMAADEGLAGFAFTNASPLVAPSNSTSRMLGTNPISVAFPSLKSKPFVLDMATTTAANGKLEILERKKEQAPLGWIQDADGKESPHPDELKKGGALMPLGGNIQTGGHKGYGLGSMVDILSGVISGANFGPWVPPFVSFLPLADNSVGKGIGHFFMAFRPDGFLTKEEYLSRMETWMEAMRNAAKSSHEGVMVAGDPEWKSEEIRRSQGVRLHPDVLKDLRKLDEEFSINSGLFR